MFEEFFSLYYYGRRETKWASLFQVGPMMRGPPIAWYKMDGDTREPKQYSFISLLWRVS